MISSDQMKVYNLFIDRLREEIKPTLSKFYIRKNKLYIALHKVKEDDDWYTLKLWLYIKYI